jgi:hypothetical protein
LAAHSGVLAAADATDLSHRFGVLLLKGGCGDGQ